MVLVDTSVWIDHLRNGNERLVSLLNEGTVLCHPYIIGELACGSLKNREEILNHLQALTQVPVGDLSEIIYFIERHNLMARGIGFIDVSLLLSTVISGCRFWTLDKRLSEIAEELKIS